MCSSVLHLVFTSAAFRPVFGFDSDFYSPCLQILLFVPFLYCVVGVLFPVFTNSALRALPVLCCWSFAVFVYFFLALTFLRLCVLFLFVLFFGYALFVG